VLLQYRTLRNYRTLMYVLPRLLEKLLFAAVLLSLYWGKVGVVTHGIARSCAVHLGVMTVVVGCRSCCYCTGARWVCWRDVT
jgi:hypothetical protein